MAGFGTFDIGNTIAQIDAIKTAKLRTTMAENAMADRQRELADQEALRNARGAAWGGDPAALGQLARLAPGEAQGIRAYFEGLSEQRRARELQEAKEQTEEMGKVSAWVLAQPDKPAAWAQIRENLPENMRDGLPERYNEGFVAAALARATSIDTLLDELSASKGQAAFNAGIDAMTAQPQSSAPERELAPGAPVPGPQMGIKGPGERATYAYSKYVNAGVPPQVAAGLVGNFMQESGAELNASAWNPQESALGIAQWRGDRLANLQRFAASRGTNPEDFDTQLEFALHELQTTESGAAQHIFGAQNAADAAALIDQHYERSSGEHRNQRVSYAQALMDQGGAETTMGGGMDPRVGDLMKLAGDPSLTDPQRQLVATLIDSMQPQQPEPTNFQREYEFARSQGFEGTPEEWKRSGGTTINNTIGQQQQEAASQKMQAAGIVLSDIQRAKELVNNSTLPTTGAGGAVMSNLPGTGAADLRFLLDGIKANIGFDKLAAIRAASPTGGALGAVSERENVLLQSTLGSLEQSQSREQFIYNLDRLAAVYQASMANIAAAAMQDGVDLSQFGLDSAPVGAGSAGAPAPLAGPPQPPSPASGPQNAPTAIQSVDQYNALPSGTQYVDPNGNVRTKR